MATKAPPQPPRRRSLELASAAAAMFHRRGDAECGAASVRRAHDALADGMAVAWKVCGVGAVGWGSGKGAGMEGRRAGVRHESRSQPNARPSTQPQDLTYAVPTKKGPLTLLHPVTGRLLPGRLAALLGPSGSGKTTLLDVLAGRKTVGTITGVVKYAGATASPAFLRRYTGYVEQFDALLANLTVREMLAYTAAMKLPRGTTAAAVRERVDAVLTQLALQKSADVKIGSPLARGVSGGQAKRVNVGCALVANPRVLFLDEPTSGLDSYAGARLVAALCGLAKAGITVCATIHSPSAAAFDLFDDLTMLLSGRVAYTGGAGADAVSYFRGMSAPSAGDTVADSSHAAEWLVELTTRADRDGKSDALAAAFAASPAAAAERDAVDALLAAGPPDSAVLRKELGATRSTATPAWHGFAALMRHRGLRDVVDPAFMGPRVGDRVFNTLLLILIYYRVGAKDTIGNATNIPFFLQTALTLTGFTAAVYLPALYLERGVYVRERADGLYAPGTYLAYKLAVEFFIAATSAAATTAALFHGVALHGSWLYFYLVYMLSTFTAISLGYLFSAASPSLDVANAALPSFVVVHFLLMGALIRFPDMPAAWRWTRWVNWLACGWAGLMVNETDARPFEIAGLPAVQFFDLGWAADKWIVVGALSAFTAFYVAAAWAVLRFKRLTKR